MKRVVYALPLLAIALMIESCVAVKSSSKELSVLGKAYHNTTAKYNGYFNANEILTATLLTMEGQNKDNYTQILEVYPYMGIDNPKAAAPELDEAVKKVTKVAALHPKSDWVDDCYLLAGKAHFLKQDFETAEQTLRFLTNEFSPEKARLKKAVQRNASGRSTTSSRPPAVDENGKVLSTKDKARIKKKAQKEKEKISKKVAQTRKKYNADVAKARKQGRPLPPKPEILNKTKTATSSTATTKTPEQIQKEKARKEEAEAQREKDFLKNKPAYYEGVLWLARTFIERDNENQAFRSLTELESDQNTPDAVRAELAPLLAHFYIQKKQYEEAIKPLEQAIELADNAKNKARYNFILAQLHQRAGRWNEAYSGFEKVASSSVNYEMQFNARLNMAQNSWLSGKGSAATATTQLERMLKDQKNQEYRDRIYYALANVALKNNDRTAAIKYLTLSVRSSSGNPAQSTESYYTLANLYFDEEKFIETKNYLDSTLTIMDKKDDRQKTATVLRDNLVDISKNLSIIQLQDSMLRLSALSDAELKKRAAKIKKDNDEKRIRDLENVKAPTVSNPAFASPTARPLLTAGGPPQAALFWAYDEKEIKQGKREFQRAWGERPLEDNWRRSQKRGISNENTTAEVETPAATSGTDNAEEANDVATYLGPVPRTDAERRTAEVKLIDASYKLGVLYYDKLQNYLKTVSTLEGLNSRFTRHNFELNSWYYLYLGHTKLNQTEKAKVYYDKIVGGYPTSTFARVLQDPNYAAEFLNEEKKVNVYYDEAYAAFKNGNYQDAFKMCADSKVRFGAENKLASRFALLSALCTGNLQGKEAYINALNEVIARYPTSEEQKRAKEILRLLGVAGAQLPDNEERTDDTQRFRADDKAIHFILVVFDNEANLEAAKAKISDYNRNYHKLDKVTITNLFLGDDEKTRKLLVILRRFENKGAAMKYYDGVMKNRNEFMTSGLNYQLLPISMDNYRSVLRDKTVDGYGEFFEANYFK